MPWKDKVKWAAHDLFQHIAKCTAVVYICIHWGQTVTHKMAEVRQEDTRSSDPENTPLFVQERGTTSDGRSKCKIKCTRRSLPKEKGLALLFLVYSLESFAFYSAAKGIRELLFDEDLKHEDLQQQAAWESFLYSLLSYSLGRLFYPLAGILADSLLGRYRVIEIGLWVISCGLFLICISLSIVDEVPHSVGRITLPILCIILFVIGTASVEVNAVSFGVDQLSQGCTSDQISCYFFWYYVFRNIGILLGVGVDITLFSLPQLWSIHPGMYYSPKVEMLLMSLDIHYKALLFMLLATITIVVGLILHVVKHHWYFKNTQRENPVKTVVNVTWFSLTVKRHAPIRRRAFRYGEARQPRIELAKIEYDGIFEAETVENVKTFYQILFLIVSLGGFFASNGAVSKSLFNSRIVCLYLSIIYIIQ